MNAVISQEGHFALPANVRDQLHLAPGDDFEVAVEDEDTITLRRVSAPANRGLVDLLLNCPFPLGVVRREADDTSTPVL